MRAIDPQTQTDLDALIDYALPLAHRQLASRKRLQPYAAVIRADGEVVPFEVPWSPDYASAGRWVADLIAEVRADPEVRAAAIGSDAKLADGKTDSIRVIIEHRDGTSVTADHPYRMQLIGGLRLAQLQVTATQPRIWTPAE